MRLLTKKEFQKLHEDFFGEGSGDYSEIDDTDLCYQVAKAQAELTESDALKEVGDEMMKMSTLQEFHALRVRLIQGKLDV